MTSFVSIPAVSKNTFGTEALATRLEWASQLWEFFSDGPRERAIILGIVSAFIVHESHQLARAQDSLTLSQAVKTAMSEINKNKNATMMKKYLERDMADSKTMHYLHAKERGVLETEKKLDLTPLQFLSAVPFRSFKQFMQASVPAATPFKVFKVNGKSIYMLKFTDKVIQGLAFDRLSVYAEAIPGTVMSDDELWFWGATTNLEGGGGHDYTLSTMARFFTEAANKKVALNLVEKRILAELLATRLLVKSNGNYQAPVEGALVSIDARMGSTADIAHELNHAIYFVEKEYHGEAAALFQGLPENEKTLITAVLKALSSMFPYAFEKDHDLFLREFIAFFRDPDELWNSYLKVWEEPSQRAEPTSPLAALKPYFASPKSQEALRNEIWSISRKVNALDRYSVVYRSLSPSAPRSKMGGAPDAHEEVKYGAGRAAGFKDATNLRYLLIKTPRSVAQHEEQKLRAAA